MIASYRPGTSPLHRCPAGPKVVALGVSMSVLVLTRSAGSVAVGAGVLVVLHAAARIGPVPAVQVLHPLRWLLLVVTVFQLVLAGPAAALVVTGAIAVAASAAGLVTATTRTTDLLDAFVRSLRPLARLGVDPDRVGLLLAFTLRSVPVIGEVGQQVREARRARGADRSPRALVVPMVQRTLHQADRLGEALAARGVDD